ncbi:MAG TPA: hypothetical protein PL033_21230 [Candidatus Brocadiia bacterium]|nr:hypothetical protein [Candidatus Brocadiia bacterium]
MHRIRANPESGTIALIDAGFPDIVRRMGIENPAGGQNNPDYHGASS